MDNKEMEVKVLQLLQSPDKGMQKLGLELMQANNLKCQEWFDSLDQIYKIRYGKKAKSKDQLIEFFNETYLNLAYRNLSTIPKSINLLINLKELHLHNNQLTSIPSELGALVNLKGLRLDHNQLTSIPSELGALVNLERLDLDNNLLTSIPPKLSMLVNLEILHLHHNPISKDHINHLKTILPKNCIIYH